MHSFSVFKNDFGCSVLKSSYIGPSVDLARNNVEVLFGDGGLVGALVTEICQSKMGHILDGGMTGPGGMVAAHLGDVRFEGAELNRGLKCRRGTVPLVIRTDMGIKFAERNVERLCDIQNQKNRATRSLDMSIRRTPSSTAEERERALKLRDDKKKYLQSSVDGAVTKLRGDDSDSCVNMSYLINFVVNV